jgi:hypothetical protein
VTRQVDGRVEAIPYKLLKGFPVDAASARLTSVVDAVVDEALGEAALSRSARRAMALFVGSSSFDISESESRYRDELARGSGALPLSSSSVANVAEGVRRPVRSRRRGLHLQHRLHRERKRACGTPPA